MNIYDFWAKSDGTTLVEHTQHVITAAKNLIDRLPFSPDENRFWKEKIIRCAILHDIGKIHPDFQAKLKPDENSNTPIRHEVISLWIIEAFLEVAEDEKFAIATHHKGIADSRDDSYKRLNAFILTDGLKQLIQRAEPLFQQSRVFLNNWNGKFNFGLVPLFPESPLSEITLGQPIQRLLKKKFQKQNDNDQRLQLARTRALLIAADHIGSARFENEIPNYRLIQPADFQPKDKKTGEVFSFRHFQERLQNEKNDVILYAPTGSGKTEAAFGWVYANQANKARLFYLLPYTASINAMSNRLQRIFGSDIVTALHSKTLDFFFEQLEKEESNHEKNAELARAKKSFSKELFYPVKVATPHQVLKNALFGKGWEMSLFDYQDACFIIDEFHAYDALLTGLMLATVKWLKREFNARIFFLSATIPQFLLDSIIQNIFEGNKNVLHQPNPKYKSDAEILNKKRHRLVSKPNKNIEDDLSKIEQFLEKGESVLVIVNNVKTSQYLFEKIEFSGLKCLLHSGFNKRDRNRIERAITNEDESKRPQLLVATQAVEVSLDIDYGVAFIENAPIDALIQRFGRVNRTGKRETTSPIYLYEKIIGPVPFYNEEVLEYTWKVLLELDGQELSENDLVIACNKVYKNGYNREQLKDFEKGFSFPTINNFRDELIPGDWRDWVEDILENQNFKIDVLCSNLLNEFDEFRAKRNYIRANQLLVSVYFYETKPVSHRKSNIRISYDLEYDETMGYIKKNEQVKDQFL